MKLFWEHFRLIQCLGRGGMGEVWLAEELYPAGKVVALKRLKAGMASMLAEELLQREFAILSRLSHPHICQVYYWGKASSSGEVYYTSEYVQGTHWRETEEGETVSLLAQVLEALHYLHSRGFCHNDLKPSNILTYSHKGHFVAKIVDFGLSRPIGTASSLTMGTPVYMAPEALRKGVASVQTDLYALGCTLFTVLTSCSPFSSFSKQDLLAQKEKGPVSVSDYLQSLKDSFWEDLILWLTHPLPQRRPQSATAVLRVLQRHFPRWVSSQPLMDFSRAPLLERDQQLRELQALYFSSSEADLAVTGPEGVGKKRLLAEFCRYVSLQGGGISWDTSQTWIRIHRPDGTTFCVYLFPQRGTRHLQLSPLSQQAFSQWIGHFFPLLSEEEQVRLSDLLYPYLGGLPGKWEFCFGSLLEKELIHWVGKWFVRWEEVEGFLQKELASPEWELRGSVPSGDLHASWEKLLHGASLSSLAWLRLLSSGLVAAGFEKLSQKRPRLARRVCRWFVEYSFWEESLCFCPEGESSLVLLITSASEPLEEELSKVDVPFQGVYACWGRWWAKHYGSPREEKIWADKVVAWERSQGPVMALENYLFASCLLLKRLPAFACFLALQSRQLAQRLSCSFCEEMALLGEAKGLFLQGQLQAAQVLLTSLECTTPLLKAAQLTFRGDLWIVAGEYEEAYKAYVQAMSLWQELCPQNYTSLQERLLWAEFRATGALKGRHRCVQRWKKALKQGLEHLKMPSCERSWEVFLYLDLLTVYLSEYPSARISLGELPKLCRGLWEKVLQKKMHTLWEYSQRLEQLYASSLPSLEELAVGLVLRAQFHRPVLEKEFPTFFRQLKHYLSLLSPTQQGELMNSLPLEELLEQLEESASKKK